MSDWNWRVIPGEAANGEPIFSVIAKRTYKIVAGMPAVTVEKSRAIIENDQYFDNGDPQTTSLEFETDLVPHKLSTDVVLLGKAYAPRAIPVREMRAALSVASTRKELLITGDRVCHFRAGADPVFTEPDEFTSMDIHYEYAYGGADERSFPDMPLVYPRNPIGRGFAVYNTRENIDGLPLPNVEDPGDALMPERVALGDPTNWNRQPLPQGFGWFHRAWYPRCSFLAAMPAFVPVDEVMRESQFGIVPANQAELAAAFRLPSRDPRFFSGGSLGLVFPYLKGDESITLENLTPDGFLEFSLPKESPKVSLDIGMGERQLDTALHSVTILTENNEVDLVWRAAHSYPGVEWLPEMKCMRVDIE